MTTVINFKSAQDTESQKNLEFFISTNKKNFIFPNNDWNDNIWDITSFLKDISECKRNYDLLQNLHIC